MTAPRRVLLKLSGEAFADADKGYGIDPVTVERVAKEIAEAHAKLDRTMDKWTEQQSELEKLRAKAAD